MLGCCWLQGGHETYETGETGRLVGVALHKFSDLLNVAKLIGMKQIDYTYTTDSTAN